MEDDEIQNKYNYNLNYFNDLTVVAKQFIYTNYMLVWGALVLAFVFYINRYTILDYILPKKKHEYKQETLEEFDENVRVNRLKLQEKFNVIAKDHKEENEKNEIDKKLNPKKDSKSKVNLDSDFSKHMGAGDSKGSYRPSYSMRNIGGCKKC